MSDYKAQYIGTGSSGRRRCRACRATSSRLTAYDGQISGGGGVDKFRIQIIRLSDSVTVFDNKHGRLAGHGGGHPQTIAGGRS